MIPLPPVGDGPGELPGWALALPFHTHRGIGGACLMCHESTWDWLDLTEAGLPLVVDNNGVSTDQSPLHARCVPALITYWRVVLGGDSAPGEPEPPADYESEPSEPEQVRVAPVGAYARRRHG